MASNSKDLDSDGKLKQINSDQHEGEEGLSNSKGMEKPEKKIDFKQASSEKLDVDSLKTTPAENNTVACYPSFSAPKEMEEMKCNVPNWRDPNFKYMRNDFKKSSRGNSSRNSSFEGGEHDKYNERHTNFDKCQDSVDNSTLGCWSLLAATDIVENNGKTEFQNLWESINKICSENKDIFYKPPEALKHKDFNAKFINCFTSDYTNKDTVFKAAVLIRRNLPSFSFVMYYSSFVPGDKKIIINLAEDEFYECKSNKMNELVTLK